MLRRLPNWSLDQDRLEWRTNLGLRGLKSLSIHFSDIRPE
jgi:hypothetical protein